MIILNNNYLTITINELGVFISVYRLIVTSVNTFCKLQLRFSFKQY